MAIDTTQLTDYSWSDIAKAAKVAMMSAAIGGAQLTINGRMIGRISISEATKLYELATRMQTAEAGGADGPQIALIEFGEAQ